MAEKPPAHGTPAPEDKPVLSGGPGAEPDAPQDDRPSGPKMVTVEYMGRKVDLPEAAAAVWQERETAMSRQGAELGEHRQWRKMAETRLKPEPPAEPDINTLWFENPQAAYQKIKQEVRQEIVGEYRQDQALKSFWDGFDRANDDLRDDRWLAEAMMKEHWNELEELTPRKAQERLGEITREQILRLTKKAKPQTESPARHLLEPASGERPTRPAREEDDDEPTSINALIAARRAKRMSPRAKGA